MGWGLGKWKEKKRKIKKGCGTWDWGGQRGEERGERGGRNKER